MEYQANYNQKPSSAKSLILGIFTGLLLIGASAEGYIAYKMLNEPATLGITYQQPSSSSANLSLPGKPGLQTFISQKYSYGFYYQPFSTASDGTRLNYNVAELESEMVVVYDDQNRQPTKLLEVFQKDPSDTLANAIKKQFWGGSSPIGCTLNSTPTLNDKNLPSSFIVAILQTPKQPPATSGSATPKTNCSGSLTATDNLGSRFFLMDPKHPNVFLFVDAGDSSLQSGKNDSGQPLNWFDTITFLDKQ